MGGVKHNKKKGQGFKNGESVFSIQIEQGVTGRAPASRGLALPGKRSPGSTPGAWKVPVCWENVDFTHCHPGLEELFLDLWVIQMVFKKRAEKVVVLGRFKKSLRKMSFMWWALRGDLYRIRSVGEGIGRREGYNNRFCFYGIIISVVRCLRATPQKGHRAPPGLPERKKKKRKRKVGSQKSQAYFCGQLRSYFFL